MNIEFQALWPMAIHLIPVQRHLIHPLPPPECHNTHPHHHRHPMNYPYVFCERGKMIPWKGYVDMKPHCRCDVNRRLIPYYVNLPRSFISLNNIIPTTVIIEGRITNRASMNNLPKRISVNYGKMVSRWINCCTTTPWSQNTNGNTLSGMIWPDRSI